MITVQIEAFSTIFDEVIQLLPFHWQELALNKDKVPLSPQYNIYRQKEKDGSLFIVTARIDGKIVGYYCGFVGRALHYETMLMCTTDIYFIEQSARGQDIGTKLFSYAKEQLKKRGVVYWVAGDKNHKPARGFLKLIGFDPIEEMHAQWIGE